AHPSLSCAHTLSHSRSRTRAETWPTKTPGCGSISQRVSSPRSEVGTFSRIITTIADPSCHCAFGVRPQRPRQCRIYIDIVPRFVKRFNVLGRVHYRAKWRRLPGARQVEQPVEVAENAAQEPVRMEERSEEPRLNSSHVK